MLISHPHRFIFIHVPRTAGQSITAALRTYVYPRQLRQLQRIPVVRALIRMATRQHYGHISARELRQKLTPACYDRYFSFAFVRNPWDWLVSACCYTRQNPAHERHEKASRLAFRDYVRWRIDEFGYSQSSLLVDGDGRALASYVGRFENLAADFAHVCREICVTAQLPRVNASHRVDYRSYYSDDLAALVGDAYREDVERFGYTFDGH